MKAYIQLRQHVGAPCKPIVKQGEKVKKGQLIAVPEGLGANIHASVYGTIEEINDQEIVVLADENQPQEYEKLKSEGLLELIEEAGVVGAGGAGFPTSIKLKADLSKGGVVLANAAECEPILNHNTHLMETKPELVIKGIQYVMEITKATKGIVAIKEIHMKAAMAMSKACKHIDNIEVKFLPNMYPAGDERVIVREMVGVELQPGQLPLEANAVVCNVETLKNITLAIEEKRPVITKDLTIAGRVKNAQKGRVFMDMPIGVPVKQFIDECGGYVEPYGEIVIGGPFTGRKGSETSPVTKTSGGVIVSMPFPDLKGKKVGVIACECGAQEPRLKEIIEGMGGVFVAEKKCKRMKDDGRGRFRCELPGQCPGQAETVLYLKKHGAEVVITGTCED